MADDDDELPRRRGEPGRRPAGGSNSLLLVAVFGAAGLLAVAAGVVGLWVAGEVVAPTAFPPATEDYATARQKFKTTLTRKGPAPQAFADVTAPDDVDDVTFPSGNLTLRAWLTAEPEEIRVRKPAVLFLHGGFAFGEEDWAMAAAFEEAGYVVMVPMLRGENGQAGDYTMFYDEVADVLAAADYLAAQPHVDPNRIYVAGHSAGGTLAMLAAMAGPRFKACAALSGSPDQPKWAEDQPEYVPFDPADESEFRMRSPLAFPASFKCPARLYYGDEEPFFKRATDDLARLAAAAGKDVKAEEVPGDHTAMTDAAIPRAIAFFNGVK